MKVTAAIPLFLLATVAVSIGLHGECTADPDNCSAGMKCDHDNKCRIITFYPCFQKTNSAKKCECKSYKDCADDHDCKALEGHKFCTKGKRLGSSCQANSDCSDPT